MSDHYVKKLVTRKGLIIDVILTGVWFAYFTYFLRDYVPAQTETYRLIFAAFTSSCLSGVFWLTISMFRMVQADQRLRNQE